MAALGCDVTSPCFTIVDSTIVRAHQHAAGAKKGSEDQAIGRSRVA
jgi:hypothetical protein